MIGLDCGTSSVRASVVDVANGREVGTAVRDCRRGTVGAMLSHDANLARRHPADSAEGSEKSIRQALSRVRKNRRCLRTLQVIGIGVDATGSTPKTSLTHGAVLL
jgi:ribulose kinase